jgi:hypothetical protein
MQVCHASHSALLLIPAFPALTKLHRYLVELEDGALFSMLAAQATCQLSSITLYECNMEGTAVDAAAAALAQLPSLKTCRVKGEVSHVPLRIASQLTALTRLEGGQEAGVPPPDTQLVKAISRNTGLQSLRVSSILFVSLSAEMLQGLLMSCSNLTKIDLFLQMLDDDGLDTLLQHGTNITDLTLGVMDIARDRADRMCKWRSLRLLHTTSVLAGLAYLPLKSVQELMTCGIEGTLRLPLTPLPQLDLLLQQAVTNLVSCPAWQKQPATRILLYTHPWYITGMRNIKAAQMLSALSPLQSPHLQHLGISIDVHFGQQEVQVLARSLGSSLRSLSLRRGCIKPSFWPALSEHLPHLKELGLMHKVTVNILGITAYLRTVTQPFTLYIGPDVLADETLEDLIDNIEAWQLQNVAVEVEYPDDEVDFSNPYEKEE